jgi:hypothetical protein
MCSARAASNEKSHAIRTRNAFERELILRFRGGKYVSSYSGANNYYQSEPDDGDDEEYDYADDRSQPELGIVGSGLENRKLGFILSGSGVVVTILGMTLFFNSALLRIGNILFVSGFPLIVGLGRSVSFFSSPARLRGTMTFGCGLFLVVVAGWPITGLLVEGFGFLNLFGNFFPLLRSMFGRISPGDFLKGASGVEDERYGGR